MPLLAGLAFASLLALFELAVKGTSLDIMLLMIATLITLIETMISAPTTRKYEEIYFKALKS